MKKNKQNNLTWRQSLRMVFGQHPDQEISPNWPVIFFILLSTVFYWAGKIDERQTMQHAAIYHGCASAKEINYGTDEVPSLDLNTFKWNISPTIKQ